MSQHDVDASPGSGTATQAGGKLRSVWVVMKDKPNLAAVTAKSGWKARGRAAYTSLTQQAQASQSSLASWLTARQIAHRGFWAVNTVKVTADAATLKEIETRPDVDRIVDDFQVIIPPPEAGSGTDAVSAIEWNIQEVGAPAAWSDFGTTGEGIVVGTIDTGVDFEHPALVNQYRGRHSDGTFVHDYNWFDPSGVCGFPSDTPCDNAGHGTHTMGTIAGNDGGDNQIGVAPGVRWIAAKGCEDFSCSFEALLSAGQWMLAPTDLQGNNPDPDQRPHVVSNSWGGWGGDEFYMEIVDAWIAAGIFPTFSNGNSGPECVSSGSPGDYAESYSVGAYDSEGYIAWFSSRGESVFGVTKPNIAAPGVDVRSSVPGGDYDWYSGTSMAAPHVAGAVALLWSAAPAIQGDIEATREVLDLAAIDTDDTSCGGEPENNNVWGQGKLNIPQALELAPIGPTGYLAGNVSAADGSAIAGAKISVTGTASRNKATNAQGDYSLRLPVGGYDVDATAFGFVKQNVPGIAVTEDQTTTLDFSLVQAPSFAVQGFVRDAAGGRVEGATVRLLDTPLEPYVTNVKGKFLFPTVPAGTYSLSVDGAGCYAPVVLEVDVSGALSLDVVLERRTDAYGYQCYPVAFDYVSADTPVGLEADDGSVDVPLPFPFTFYGETYSTVSVDSNGYIAFENPYSVFDNQGIPNMNPPNAAIYGLWDDLIVEDASQLLTTVVGEAPSRKVVFEWRDVAFYEDPSQRANFEIVLHESGEVTVQYQPSDSTFSRGSSATVGIENGSGDVALQYSRNQALLRSGLALRFEVPFSGFVQGTLIDKNDSEPIAGATITAVRTADGTTRTATSNASGFYRLQATKGGYELTVTKTNYVTRSGSVTIRRGETTVRDYIMKTPRAALTPSAVQLVIPEGTIRTRTLSLSNTGSAPLQFEFKESGGKKQNVTVTTRLKRSTAKDPLALTSEGLFKGTPTATSPLAVGDILDSFQPSGVGLGWGIGLAGDLWISDVFALDNHGFQLDGTPTGVRHLAPWAGDWAADMAFDEATGTVCQLAVGNDNGIYCWDPESGDVVTEVHDQEWAWTSQRGLAHRASDDTFFLGGWNEGVIYHVQGASGASPGAVISTCMPADGSISGLAYNNAVDVLWAATNSFEDTIYQLDPNDCTVLSTLAPPQRGGFQGAGLELDPEGNLWAVAQSPNQVYLIDSGVPAFGDVSWLSAEPAQGELTQGDKLDLTVTVDTTGLEPGLYLATLFVVTNSGREPTLRVPVSLVVSGYVRAVNAGGAEYLDTSGEIWVTDQKHTKGSWGYVKKGTVLTTTTDIKQTPDPVLYQSQRANAYAYRFDDVPDGVYEVDMRFAEIQGAGVGQRLFDVIVEDDLVLPAHDITYESGKNRADDHRFFVDVTDGRLDVRFVPREGSKEPVVNALRVVHRPDR